MEGVGITIGNAGDWVEGTGDCIFDKAGIVGIVCVG